MTNEVATSSVAVTDKVCEKVSQQLTQGQELWNQVLTWLSEKGLNFAVSLVVSILILLVGWLVIGFVKKAVTKALQKGVKQNTLLTNFTVSVITKTLWAFLIVTILGRLGVNVGPLIAGLGVTGFILGFAFQESLGNLASGLMIAINTPFKVGDYVIIAGLEGTVLEVNMMATVMATADNKKIVVPNKSAWGSPITNFSAMATRRVDLQMGIGYDCDVSKAIKVALETLNKVQGVLPDPAASVSVASLGDNEIMLNVRPWAKNADYWAVYSASYQALVKAFAENGLEIPFPQLDVHLDK